MKRETGKNKRAIYVKESIGIWIAIVVLFIVVFFSTWWLLKSSQKTTEGAVYDVSKLYLEELTTHKANQFTSTLESKIQQLFVTAHALRKSDLADKEMLQNFIGQMQLSNGFDFFAMVDEQGTVYTKDSSFPGNSLFSFLDGDFTKPYISFGQDVGSRNLVLITVPVENWPLGGSRLVAAAVGIDAGNVAESLSLSSKEGHSFCNIITTDGGYVVRTPHEHIEENTNLFSALEGKARFQEGTSLKQWKEDVNARRAGMAVYGLQNMVHYTYYMPIEGTDWLITTTLHYDLISGNVDVIRTTLTRNSIFQLFLILLVLLALFAVFVFMHRRNDLLWFEKMKAEESSKAKSVFLSNMSHDIRTPMNAIIGFTNLALKNVEDTEKIKDYLAKILASGNHLLALINDVLEMSRIESGKIHLEETACNLSGMLRDLNSIIHGQVQGKHQKLSMDTTALTDENVYCDKLRMNQVMLNLLGNAIKFTPEGGEISVVIEQTGTAPAGYGAYVIRVKDNGIGMAPEFATKVFNPFERERTSTVSGIQGTGLGMSITKSIIDKMNGTIEVVTAPGQGSEFIIRIQFRLQEKQEGAVCPARQEEASDRDFDFTGRRVLLAEDNELNREIAIEVLTEAGFEVEEAGDGSIVVEKLRGSEPGYYDVVLMDIQMPVMDGYKATRAIRSLADPKLAAVPIIAMTANAFEEDRQAALDCGMDGHLAKPLDLERLFLVLEEAIRGHRKDPC